jgi:hypothetical protein
MRLRSLGSIKGRRVELIADGASRKLTGRTEVSHDVKVNAAGFVGMIPEGSPDAAGTLAEVLHEPCAANNKR